MGDSVLKPLFEKYEADIPQWKERYTRALHGERLRFESKIEYTNPDSYWDFSFTPIFFKEQISGVACHVRNITAERKKELEHKQSQELFKLIAENPLLGIVWATPEGIMINANDTFCKILESTLVELRDIYYGNYTFPEDLEKEKPLFEKLKKGEIENYVLEKRYVTRRGNVKWVKVNLSTAKNKENEIQYITCVVQEIGERKNAQTQLLQSENNLRAILDHMNAACMLLDSELRIVTYNKPAEKWMMRYVNYVFSEGESVSKFIPENYASFAKKVLDVAMAGTPYRFTGKYSLVEDQLSYYDARIAPVMNADQKVLGIVVTVEEITDEINAQAEIKTLNQNLEAKVKARTAQLETSTKEMEAFTYSISHDLRAPLRNINGFAEILMEDHADILTSEMKKNLSVIKSNAIRMGLFIDSLLEISRSGRSAMVVNEVNMMNLVEEVVEELKMLNNNFRAEIIIGLLPSIKGDISLLRQVWQNLISNAVKYSAQKQHPRVEIAASEGDGKIHYTVKDNGIGFDMQYSHKLFGVFQRLHRDNEFEGTGVGLAIVKRIVQRHKGNVGVQSAPNAGTTFYFSLPK